MEELIRTNDLVTIAFAEALLKDSRIAYLVADQAVSSVEGMIGSFPRRILVDSDEIIRARRLMTDAGLGHELRPERRS